MQWERGEDISVRPSTERPECNSGVFDGNAAKGSAKSHQRDDSRGISGEPSTGTRLAEASAKNHRRDSGEGISGEPSAERPQRHQWRAIRGTAIAALSESLGINGLQSARRPSRLQQIAVSEKAGNADLLMFPTYIAIKHYLLGI